MTYGRDIHYNSLGSLRLSIGTVNPLRRIHAAEDKNGDPFTLIGEFCGTTLSIHSNTHHQQSRRSPFEVAPGRIGKVDENGVGAGAPGTHEWMLKRQGI